MADASKGFPAKAVRPELTQIVKLLDLARREPLAQYGEVGFLLNEAGLGWARTRRVSGGWLVWEGPVAAAAGSSSATDPDP